MKDIGLRDFQKLSYGCLKKSKKTDFKELFFLLISKTSTASSRRFAGFLLFTLL